MFWHGVSPEGGHLSVNSFCYSQGTLRPGSQSHIKVSWKNTNICPAMSS